MKDLFEALTDIVSNPLRLLLWGIMIASLCVASFVIYHEFAEQPANKKPEANMSFQPFASGICKLG